MPEPVAVAPVARYIGWDTETWRIQPGRLAPRLVCLTTAEKGTKPAIYTRADGVETFRRYVTDPTVTLIAHNSAFDVAVMVANAPDLLEPVFDALEAGRLRCTKIREMLLKVATGEYQRRPSFSLAACAARHLTVTVEGKGEDAWRLRYHELDGVPLSEWPDDATSYAKLDAHYALRVFDAQTTEGGDIADETSQTMYAFALHLMACRGLITDAQAVNDLETSIVERIRVIDFDGPHSLTATGVKKVKKDGTTSKDTKVIQALVTTAYKGNPPKTPSDRVSTAGETLRGTPCKGDPCVKNERVCDSPLHRLESIGEDAGELSKYVGHLKRAAVRPINPSITPIVATGRTSVARPPYQQFPRRSGVRECIVPRPGFVFVGADYNANELVTLAQVLLDMFGASKLADVIRAGKDPHLTTGSLVLGITYDEAKARLEAGDRAVKDARQLAKCFHPDTEVLSRGGWKRIADLQPGEEVVQATPKDGCCVLDWAVPTQVFTKPNDGDELVHVRSEGIDLRVTPDHRMLGFRATNKHYDTTPEELTKARYWTNAGCLDNQDGDTASFLRLAVATQADGNYNGKRIRFGFSKARKVDRLLLLLLRSGFVYDMTMKGDVVNIVISARDSARIKENLEGKSLPWSWLGLAPMYRAAVLDELRYWDGHERDNWKAFQYYSTDKQSLDVAQALASLSGHKTRLRWTDNDNPKHKPVGALTVRATNRSRGGSVSSERIEYGGDVVCLSVPSSYVLVRDGGVPVITGQCLNFGLPGGLGAKTFVEYAWSTWGVRVSETEARMYKDSWKGWYPEIVDYFDFVAEQCDAGGGSFTLVQPWSGRVRGGVSFCNGCNSPFQGLAADMTKQALWAVTKESYLDRPVSLVKDTVNGRVGHQSRSPLYGCRPVLFMHDEIICEAPEATAPEAADRLATLMIQAGNRLCPDVPVTAEPYMMRRWEKGAETVRDANGRLQMWGV